MIMRRIALFSSFSLAMFLILGCGVGEENNNNSQPVECVGTCFDLSSLQNEITVNNDPLRYEALPDADLGYKFNTTEGYKYKIVVDALSGKTNDLYVSDNAILDTGAPKYKDHCRYDCELEFVSTTSSYHYILLRSGSTQTGLNYSIRVFSFDENLSPLPDTSPISPNGASVPFSLIQNEIKRYYFNTQIGNDYTIRPNCNIAASLYLSRIPSVDSETAELRKAQYSESLEFRATKATTYYIGVKDSDNTSGSECALEVIEE